MFHDISCPSHPSTAIYGYTVSSSVLSLQSPQDGLNEKRLSLTTQGFMTKQDSQNSSLPNVTLTFYFISCLFRMLFKKLKPKKARICD